MVGDGGAGLADYVRARRLRAGLTQDQLARRAGLTANTVGDLERGQRRRLYPSTARALANALALDDAERAELAALASGRATDAPLRTDPIAAPAPARPSATAQTPPSNLPAPLTSFVGRERELTTAGLFVARGVRLLTLTGTGGAGKTRLAVEGARAVRRHFPGGVWFIDLAPVAAARVRHAVAAVLGVRDAPERPILDGIVAALRERTSLLVLDNCEHAVKDCAELASHLLRHCPTIAIIATSREALAVAGEQIYPVPPLALPPEGNKEQGTGNRADSELKPQDSGLEAPEALLQYASIQLFVDRARAVRPDFALTVANAGAVVAACRRLDGLPLAIELAAAWMRTLSPAQLSARLDDRFRLLMGGARDTPPQHQTLRALIDWSYDLLATPERTLLRRLSVFAGGFSLEAAEDVCRDQGPGNRDQASPQPTVPCSLVPGPSEDVLDILSSLVDKSLVVVESREDSSRYLLLESIREYAREKLAATGEMDAIRDRHATHYLELAERAAPELRGREQVAWLRRLDADHTNLRTALVRAGEIGDVDLSARLCVALTRFWQSRGYLTDGHAWFAAALTSRSGDEPSPLLRSKLLLGAGQLALWLEVAEAIEILTEAVTLARALGAREVLAESLIWLGTTRRRQLEFASGRMAIEEGMALARSSGDTACLALAELMLGMTLANEDDLTGAAPWFAQALEHFLEVGDARWVAITRMLLGGCLLEIGDDLAYAGRVLHAGLFELHAVGERPQMITGLLSLAHQAVLIPDPVRAARLLGAADALSESIGASWTPVVADKEQSVLSLIRAQLSEPAITAARTEGRRLSLEDVLAEADAVGV